MKLKVCLAGVTGWIGRPLADAISGADGVTVSGSVAEALATPCDVFVDYTSAEA